MIILSNIIFWAFVVWATVQFFYVVWFYWRMLSSSSEAESIPSQPPPPISIIICARNEARNLERNLPPIFEQVYSGPFEVVVVNDCSTDATAEVLQQFQAQYPTLIKVVEINTTDTRRFKGKKHALGIGVANATYDHLLLTDADCRPAGNKWLSKMTQPFSRAKEIVAGYGAYNAGTGLLNSFVRWESVNAFVQGVSYAKAGKPYLAVGRNMACTKSIFLRAERSEDWNISASGDDDMIVSLYGTTANYTIVNDAEAFTYTDAPAGFGEWIRQKQRHLSDGKNYNPKVKYWLSTFGFTHSAIWVYYIALLFLPQCTQASYIMLARCLVYWLIWAVAAIRLKQKGILPLLPFFDFVWMIFNIAFSPYIISKNKQHWT